MKKIIAAIAAVTICIALFTTIGSAAEVNGALINDEHEQDTSIFNKATYDKFERAKAHYADIIAHKAYDPDSPDTTPRPRYMEVTRKFEVPVSNFTQQKTNWCGPASIAQSLSYHKTKSKSTVALPSQTTLATKLGIANNSNGASSALMANIINSYDKSFGDYPHYYAMDITFSPTVDPIDILWNTFCTDLKDNTNAPIILLETQYLTRYNGTVSRHYNSVSGIKYVENAANGDTFAWEARTVDPHYNAKYRGIYYDSMGSKNTNGVGRAVYYADKNGSNEVVLW